MRARQWLVAVFLILASTAWAQSTFPLVSWPPSPVVKIAVNPVTNKVYTLDEFANAMIVTDMVTGASRSVQVGPRPQYVAVNPATNRVYVNTSGDSSLTVIDGATDSVIALLPIGSLGPIQINPFTNIIYVVRLTGPGTDEVTFVNGDTHSYYTIATESYQPISVAINPLTNKLYIAHYATGDVRVISGAMDGNAHPATLTIGVWQRPFAIAANPMTNKIYTITEDSRGPIAVIDGATNTAVFPPVATGRAVKPKAIAVNTVTNKVYAVFRDEVVVVDGQTNAYTYIPLATGNGPAEVAINAATNKIYVSTDLGTLTVIDGVTHTTSTTSIPASVNSLGVNPITNKVYAFGAGTLILDGATSNAPPVPLTTTVSTTSNSGGTATFTLQASSGFGPAKLPIQRVYYQLDSTAGAWKSASGSGPFSVTLSGLATGAHVLYAFATDGQDAPLHTASQSAPLVGAIAAHAFSVGTSTPPALATPSVSLATSLNPSGTGQPVTFTATVSGSAGTPSGTVDFRDGATSIAGCATVSLGSGTASCTTSGLSAGTHSITARYSGDSAYTAATSGAINQAVNVTKVNASLALSSSLNPSTVGTSVTFTAALSGANGTPTGSVEFLDGSTPISGCAAAAVSSGRASCVTAGLAQGTHTITARYSGDAAYNAGTSATLSQAVNAVAPAPAPPAAEMISPVDGSRFTSKSQAFSWKAIANATYTLMVGTTVGGSQLAAITTSRTTEKVNGLPHDGRRIYVRLVTKVNGTSAYRDYAYYAFSR